MTRERAKELLPILTAWANGETIQYNGFQDVWRDVDGDNPEFDDCAFRFRIKPKPRDFWLVGSSIDRTLPYQVWSQRPPSDLTCASEIIHVREIVD